MVLGGGGKEVVEAKNGGGGGEIWRGGRKVGDVTTESECYSRELSLGVVGVEDVHNQISLIYPSFVLQMKLLSFL
jgi:hypothetical protein